MSLPVRFPGRNFIDISYFLMHTSLLYAVLQQLLAGAHDSCWTENLAATRGELSLRRGRPVCNTGPRFVSLFKDGLWFSEALSFLSFFLSFFLSTLSVLYYVSRWKEKWSKAVAKSKINALRYPVALTGRSRWPRGLWCGSAAARLLGLRFRIPPGAWMSVCCECCVLSGRGLCDELIPRPEESYRMWCGWVWYWKLNNEEA
jgi:hypothetical protein